jgi:hypothetical protein
MTLQYHYALDHLKQIARNKKDGDEPLDLSRHAVDAFFMFFTMFIWFAAIYYIDPFKNVSEGFGSSEKKYKFEIKKAKDIEQRLNDVKGIDEIRDEINDLI